MAAHISFSGVRFPVAEGETVLECLTRNGVNVPHACCAGVCQSCLVQATAGEIPAAAQAGLKPTYVKQGLLLACQCKPTGDLAVRLAEGSGLDMPVQVLDRAMLNHNVMRLRLGFAPAFACEPGQYVTLANTAGLARSYSVANDPAHDGYVELHIRLLPGGLMSTFLDAEARVGLSMVLRGPAGNCFYAPEGGGEFPMVLAGTGTGLAPLYGIARQALAKGHAGHITLFHGALRESDLYLVEALQGLQAAHGNFSYVPCVLGGTAESFYRCGNVEDMVMASLPADTPATRLFLCGAPEFVKSLKRKAFLKGVRSAHIYADAFLPAKSVASAA